MVQEKKEIGDDVLSHRVALAVPSARRGLTFRVRNGIGWDPRARVADQGEKQKSRGRKEVVFKGVGPSRRAPHVMLAAERAIWMVCY